MSNSGPLTLALRALADGDAESAGRFMPLLYAELRRIAAGRAARRGGTPTLDTTALVHEAWIRLERDGARFEDRGHFFHGAARAMRDLVVEAARRKGARKRDARRTAGGAEELAITLPEAADLEEDVLRLDGALEELERLQPRPARVVSLRFFAGLPMAEIAALLELSLTTVESDWRYARAWLRRRLGAAG